MRTTHTQPTIQHLFSQLIFYDVHKFLYMVLFAPFHALCELCVKQFFLQNRNKIYFFKIGGINKIFEPFLR